MGTLVIFDIDGTLLRTDRVTIRAVRETFAEHGLEPPQAEAIRATFGQPVDAYEAWLADLVPAGMATEFVEATNRRELEVLAGADNLYPGARETLDALKAGGHRLAVCSNGSDAYVSTFLDAHGVRPHFDLVCCRGHDYRDKAAMVGHILAQVAERPAFVVGDREEDIAAAHANGIFAIAADYGFGTPDDLAEADKHIGAISELPAVVA
ncbi:MAG TPA: HAD family hydrolase [Candidatus Hydrogenedentes bacterium]|nr:HAD family hydrolase [Candidatus Hydrogenedentota bacterium]HPG68251.1 HAD family hydrolase [Candidatus Hydrogenedentota bacterium]